MNLYLMTKTDEPGFDEYIGFVVAHESAASAEDAIYFGPLKYLAKDYLITAETFKVHYIGVASEDITEPRILLESFRAG